jgi:hypothetical protein
MSSPFALAFRGRVQGGQTSPPRPATGVRVHSYPFGGIGNGLGEFWEHTLENWQSEFLAVGSFAAFTIFLRQRGSPESKRVGAPHEATGVEG